MEDFNGIKHLAEALKTAEQSYTNRLKFPPKADSDSEETANCDHNPDSMSSSNKSDTTSEESADYSPPNQKDPTYEPGKTMA
ncbi:hypothetical protein GTA08_BOTSDO08432 [Botryosphaeria dothidea]|uniref:Uncharacterized protein n=1 Tax=Botryosphaeria dothidea TaxID=55169 RepID=A0A8H4MZ95_9PEZI|nr:hypothetical protein GTA08_BOTSDO08432 [Botryosphaeria dothidea]